MMSSSDEDEEAGSGPMQDEEVACDAAGAVGQVVSEPETIVDLTRRTRKKRVTMHTSRARVKRDREQDVLPPPMCDPRYIGTSYMESLREHPQGVSGRWIPQDVVLSGARSRANDANCTPDISSQMHDGCVYGCGNNSSGQLGLGHKRLFVLGQSAINCPSSMTEHTKLRGVHSYAAQPWKGPLVAAAAGESYSIICTESGTFVAGSGQFGTLGLGSRVSIEPDFVPVPMLSGIPVKTVACGYAHSVLGTAEALPRTLSWGSNSHGQLGHKLEDASAVTSPRAISTLAGLGVRTIACGRQHSLVVTEEGELWAFGRHCSGQLGLGGVLQHVSEPTRVAMPEPEVTDASAGSHHSLALLRSGTVVGFGYNSHGQLGRYLPAYGPASPPKGGEHTEYVEEREGREWVGGIVRVPFRVKLAEREVAVLIACGALHSVVVTESVDCGWKGRRVYCCGAGGGGQLGNASTQDRSDMTLVSGLAGCDVRRVSCGMFSSLAVVQMEGALDGCSLVAWGMDIFGRNVRKLSSLDARAAAPSTSACSSVERADVCVGEQDLAPAAMQEVSEGPEEAVLGTSPANVDSQAALRDSTADAGTAKARAMRVEGERAVEAAYVCCGADVDGLAEACGEMEVCSGGGEASEPGGSSAGDDSRLMESFSSPEHSHASREHASPDTPAAARKAELAVSAAEGIWTQRSAGREGLDGGEGARAREGAQAAAQNLSTPSSKQERRGRGSRGVSSEKDVVLVLPPLARLQLAKVVAGPCSNHAVVVYRRRLVWQMARVVWAGVLKASPEQCRLAWLPRETAYTSMVVSRILQLASM